MKRFLAAVVLLGLAAPLAARKPEPIFVLGDPRGDDHGDGTFQYPLRSDLARGDFDLLSLEARPESGGTLFVATFARPVAPTSRRTIDFGGGNLDSIARFGFYTLNLDIYIDTDRVPGSGSTVLLPGRKAEADPANAWEKAICLTPRPYEAKEELRRLLARFAKKDLKEKTGKIEPGQSSAINQEVRGDIEERVFFPTRIRVFGQTIEFFVPGSFLLGGAAKPEWSYIVAVSGADIFQRVDVTAAVGLSKPEPDTLMILPVEPGRSQEVFGTNREDPLQPPLVDVIVPDGQKQEDVLKDDDPKAGRPVRLVGVVPGKK